MASECSLCGTTSEDDQEGASLPLGWSLSTTPDRIDRWCPECTRLHVRDIEAKLDVSWWA